MAPDLFYGGRFLQDLSRIRGPRFLRHRAICRDFAGLLSDTDGIELSDFFGEPKKLFLFRFRAIITSSITHFITKRLKFMRCLLAI